MAYRVTVLIIKNNREEVYSGTLEARFLIFNFNIKHLSIFIFFVINYQKYL